VGYSTVFPPVNAVGTLLLDPARVRHRRQVRPPRMGENQGPTREQQLRCGPLGGTRSIRPLPLVELAPLQRPRWQALPLVTPSCYRGDWSRTRYAGPVPWPGGDVEESAARRPRPAQPLPPPPGFAEAAQRKIVLTRVAR